MKGCIAKNKPSLTLLIRDDDICHATPIWMLELLRDQIWRYRPVNLSVIPYTQPGMFLKAPMAWTDAKPEFAWNNPALTDHLASLRRADLLGLSMHGWTHHSPRLEGEAHEFSGVNEHLLERVVAGFEWFDSTVGYRMFVPPHNEIHAQAEQYFLERQVSVCRSLRDEEVSSLAASQASPVSRTDAKRILSRVPDKWPLTLYQSLIINKEKLRAGTSSACDLCTEVIASSSEHGLAVVTFHWWDFFQQDGKPDLLFIRFIQQFFTILEDSVTIRYLHYGHLADALQAQHQME
ncbi:hypothetical protein [Pseudomonas sp. NPDC087615]|uniref:hypothetical protein n=1 Tax=Pseudomonas sp. NPDC087615 TaxID=3364443 RepID=UPI0037F2DF9C